MSHRKHVVVSTKSYALAQTESDKTHNRPVLYEALVTMRTGRVWVFRLGYTRKVHLMVGTSQDPEYKVAREAAYRALWNALYGDSQAQTG